jgi:hypothetical protein
VAQGARDGGDEDPCNHPGRGDRLQLGRLAPFESLLRGTLEDGFRPDMVVADKGYLSKANYQTATDLGLAAYIPFKSNSVNRAGTHGTPASWRKAFYLFQANRDEFERNYHRRSNVESVFSALKRKFGENIRSKNPVAQVNEVLCKLIAYNLTVVVHEMFENGIEPAFGRLLRGRINGRTILVAPG